MKRTSAIVLGLCVLMQAALYGAESAQWEVFETSFESAKLYTNAFVDVEVDVVFQQGEKHWKVPAFWAGGDTWKVRFAPPAQGQYTYRVECTDKGNTGLNGKQQTLQVAAYTGKNPLLQHGFLKVSADKRHFEHADGTPFFWLGDTWWKGLCKRLTWEGFQELTADRKAKGFSVVQLVCGTYPDEGLFQPGWENEGGKPYETRNYSVVNPKSGEAYAIYLHGGKQASLMLDVPAGRYRAEWVNTLTGNVDKSEEVTHGGGALTLSSPDYTDDVALRVKVIKP